MILGEPQKVERSDVMKVVLSETMGTDLTVVNAARVSYDRMSEEFGDKDEKLIKYLAEHNHWSPFAHAFAQFKIEAPIFVARQLVKHQVGLAWNEVSRRYVSYVPKIYKISNWRGKPQHSKQGSDGKVELSPEMKYEYDLYMEQCIGLYNRMIEEGIAPEQARAVLPQSMQTEWIWSGSLYAFARICNLRNKPDVQEETRFITEGISGMLENKFPICWKYLCPATGVDSVKGV
tara:strand:+ start:4674 stop:5372 length:699 start_codon:yes stop_codon:yes gene_type:complete